MAITTPAERARSESSSTVNRFQRWADRFLIRLELFLRRHGQDTFGGDWDGEDALQLVLSKAWQIWPSSQNAQDPPTFSWLITIARGVLQDRRKYLSAKRRIPASAKLNQEIFDLAALLPNDRTSVSSRIAVKEHVELLLKALENLDPKTKEIVARQSIDGESITQIANDIGLSRSTVWDRLRAGLKQLHMEVSRNES